MVAESLKTSLALVDKIARLIAYRTGLWWMLEDLEAAGVDKVASMSVVPTSTMLHHAMVSVLRHTAGDTRNKKYLYPARVGLDDVTIRADCDIERTVDLHMLLTVYLGTLAIFGNGSPVSNSGTSR